MEKVFIAWREEYNLYIPEIDAQHKKIVDLINELYAAFVFKTHTTALGKIIDAMADYAEFHFAFEEKLFERFQYEKRTDHIKEHVLFNEKVKSFQAAYKANPNVLTFQVLTFLQTWLTSHICDIDKQYVTCLKKGLNS